jgi:L,D-transpeptidase YcbB
LHLEQWKLQLFSQLPTNSEVCMIKRMRTVAGWGSVAAGLAVAGCGPSTTELVTEHIRATLGGAPPAAVAAPVDGTAESDEAAHLSGGDRAPAGAEGAEGSSEHVAQIRLESGDTLHIRRAVAAFYEAREYTPAWTGRRSLSREGVRLLGALGSIRDDGLDPDRYHVEAAQEIARILSAREAGDRRVEYLGDLDLLLTEAFVRAAMDVERGVLDPAAVGLAWRFERAESDDSAVVTRLSAGEAPHAILASLRPRAPYYHRLSAGLRRLAAVEERGGWPTVESGPILRAGDRDRRVAQLRGRLLAGEDETERRLAGAGLGDAELFDEALHEAVEHFQVRHTLHEDGAFGPNTLAAVNVPVTERIQTLRLNLDRWRWLPRELGEEFLLVNVAGFELELVARDSVVESMSVVVGRTANRTPLFRDSLQYVVVNPYWNVPMSIAREEILPAVRRDPTYLERNGYEVLQGDRLVNSHLISADALDTGRYRIRQRPGPRNALGNVKFMFPNDMNIYLHDTPAGHLFSQETRAFSYGCIRVERPADLARTLLARYSDRGADEYDRLREAGREQWVALDRKIPIYILYFTAWAREDGTLRFHPDIYERDEALRPAREALLPARPATRSTSEETRRA